MTRGQRAGAIVAALAAMLLGLVVVRFRSTTVARSDRAPESVRVAGGADDDPHGSDSTQSLLTMLAQLRRSRLAEEHALADAAAARATALLEGAHDRDGTMARALCTAVAGEFIGRSCQSSGEARYYGDLVTLATLAGSRSATGSRLAIDLLDALINRGVPEEHGADQPHRHSECNVVGPFVLSVSESTQFTEEHVVRLLKCDWTAHCGVFARFVFMAADRFPKLGAEHFQAIFERSTDPLALHVAARNLARRGQLGALVELGMQLHPDSGSAILNGIATADPSPAWIEVLETVRRTVAERQDAPASWIMASQMIYSEWGKLYMRTNDRPLHDLATVLGSRVQDRWPQTTREERLALMNAVTAASLLPGGRFYEPAVDGTTVAQREGTERMLADLARRHYGEQTNVAGNLLPALGCLTTSADTYFDLAEEVLSLPGKGAAMDDALLGIRCLARRGGLAEGPDRERALGFLRRSMAEIATPVTVYHILTVAKELKATELIPDLRRMLDRVQEKRLGEHPLMPYARMMELFEVIERQKGN